LYFHNVASDFRVYLFDLVDYVTKENSSNASQSKEYSVGGGNN